MEILAVIGSEGVLEVFNEGTGNYTTAFMVNQNRLSNQVEHLFEGKSCNVSGAAVVAGDGSLVNISSSGFNVLLDLPNFRRGIYIQVCS